MIEKKKPLTVDLNYLSGILDFLARIEQYDLKDIVWEKMGKPVEVTPEQIEGWKYLGLNNREFAKIELIEGLPSSNESAD